MTAEQRPLRAFVTEIGNTNQSESPNLERTTNIRISPSSTVARTADHDMLGPTADEALQDGPT